MNSFTGYLYILFIPCLASCALILEELSELKQDTLVDIILPSWRQFTWLILEILNAVLDRLLQNINPTTITTTTTTTTTTEKTNLDLESVLFPCINCECFVDGKKKVGYTNDSYFECQDNTWIEKFCLYGQVFSEDNCVLDHGLNTTEMVY